LADFVVPIGWSGAARGRKIANNEFLAMTPLFQHVRQKPIAFFLDNTARAEVLFLACR